MNKTIRNISPLALLTLAACKGTVGTGGFTVAGRVENGPLVDAYVFLDYNGNAIWDGGNETRVLTNGADHKDGAGSYELTATAGGYTLVALTTEQTVDTATEAGYGAGVVLQAPEGSSMITPSTTVVKELMAQDIDLTLDAAIAKVSKALGFEGTNLLTYSAYADQTDWDDDEKETALKVQLSNNKLMATVNSFAAAAEEAGVVVEGKAFELALDSVVKVLIDKVGDGDELSFSADMDEIKAEMITYVKKYSTDTLGVTIDPVKFGLLSDSVELAVGNVVTKIDTIQYVDVKDTSTTAEDISDIFSVVNVLTTKVKDSAKAYIDGGALSIDMSDAVITAVMANKAPTDISVTSSFAEDKSDLIIGTVATADVANAGIADTHTYTIVGGIDEDIFSITEGGVLSFLAQPDYETMVTLGKTSYDVAVQVKDAGNKTFVKTLKIEIVNANDTPTVSNAISDQAVTEDSSFNFQFNENVFADVDSTAALTYAATLSDDTVLPQWLTFNAATRTFGGTPTNSDVGSIAVKLTATDSGGAVISDTFNIVVSNLNDAPTVANAIPDQTIANGSALYFKFDSTTFADVDVSDTLSYVASLSDGTELPSWLIFDATARTFSGTPTGSDIGSLAIKVKATDTESVTVFDTFNITVTLTNAAPTVTSTVVTTSIQDTAYTYTFAATDTDAGDTLTYAAVTLPSWLNFNVTTGVLSGTPISSQVGTHQVVLSATDALGSLVSQNFTITVKAPLTSITGTNATFTPVLFAPYELGAVIGSVALDSSVAGTLSSVEDRVAGKTVFELSGNQLKLGDNYYFDPETKTFSNPDDLTYFTYEGQNWTLDLFNNDDTDNGYYSNTGGPVADASILISDDLFAGVTIINAPYNIGGQPAEAAAKSSTNYIDAILPDTPVIWKTSLANVADQTAAAETIITYSFPGSTANFANNYGDEVTDGFKAFTDTHIAATRLVLQEYSNIANIKFVEIAEIGSSVGTLRFTFTDHDKANPDTGGLSWGWAMGPYNQPNGGDIWVDSEHSTADAMWGQGTSYNFASLIHEVGHSLGLDHPFSGVDTLATNVDFVNYTTMSYTQPSDYAAWIGYGSEAQYLISTSPMVYDIAAIQHLYGAAEYNNGNTIYKYDPAKPVSEAIWDSGGTDTLDFSDFTLSCSINLAPGGYSTIAFTEWTLADNLGIAYGATIENAIGGGGADTIVGNSAANTLYGGTGAGVKDTLTGNGGADIFVCSLSDATTNLALADIVSDFTNGTDFIGLEDRTFSDLSISNSSGDTKIVDTSSNKVLFVLSSVDHTLIESSDFVVTDFV